MGLQAEAPAVRRNHQQFSACRVHSPQRRPRPFHQRHVRVSCLEIWNGLGVSAHSAAGLSGCAPCRLRCHGHSASIRSEEHTSELQSLMRISYAVFCLKKKTENNISESINNMMKTTMQQ